MNKYFSAALISLLAFSSIGYSQFRDPSRPPRFPENPPRYEEPGSTQSIMLNRWVINESLDLERMVRAVSRNYGSELIQVEVVVAHDLRGSSVDLIINGRSVDNDDPSGRGSILNPGRYSILGQDIRSLAVNVNGSLFIEEIRLTVGGNNNYPQPPPPPRPNPRPPRPPSPPYYGDRVERIVNEDLHGNDRLDLGQYIGLSQYRGRRVLSVNIEMESLYRGGLATAELLVNSFSQGRVNVGYLRESQFNIVGENTIGRGFDSLVLYTQGDLRVRRVILILQ